MHIVYYVKNNLQIQTQTSINKEPNYISTNERI